MAEPEIISPRGVPQMRVDWLADVARRLAEVGLDRLRSIGEDQDGHLTDVVDGETWRFELFKFSAPHDTVIEFDAELWGPKDGERPTLRAGFELAPRWNDADGLVALVRTEIGPRGAVTFDPENWMVIVPLPGRTEIPRPGGIEAGTWTFTPPLADDSEPSAEPTSDDDLALLAALPGTRLELAGLAPILAGEAVPELVAGAFPHAPSKGILGRLRGRRAPEAPVVVLRVTAQGPLTAAWTGADSTDPLLVDGLLIGDTPPVLTDDQISFRGAAGTLTLVGPGLAVTLAAGA